MAIIITGGHEEYQRLLNDMRALVRYELAQAAPTAPPAGPAADDLLTVQQAADLLSVSKATVFEWLRRGIMGKVKIGGRSYLQKSQILSAGISERRTSKPARAKSER
jgi:excisionase family DNA binding protein